MRVGRGPLDCKECGFVARTSFGLGQHITNEHYTMEQYYYKHIQKVCETCSAPIPFSRSHWKERRFCSSGCASKHSPFAVTGPAHPTYKGRTQVQGYTLVSLAELSEKDQALALPMSRSNGGGAKNRVLMEHRLVMAKHLKRPLKRGEVVHHINGDRSDNRPENLELWVRGHPAGQRGYDVECPHCGHTFDRIKENGKPRATRRTA